MISIVIPVYKNRQKLHMLLDSIKDGIKDAGDVEVIVVDDFSPQDISSDIQKEFSFVKMYRLPQRFGAAFARNKGAEAARGDVLLFLDSDVIIKSDTLVKVKNAFMDTGIVALEGEYDVMPANLGFFPRYKALEYRSFVRDQKYFTILGPRICAIKKDVFLGLGGFETSYDRASVEDYEFSHRFLDKGYRINYDKTLEVKHHFPDNIIKQCALSFNRTQLWARLFARRKKFDNFGTTFEEGIGRFAGFIFIISLPVIFVSERFAVLSFFMFLLYVVLNRHFFSLVLKTEGILFLIKSILSHMVISFFITTGFIYGIAAFQLRKVFGYDKTS